MRASLIYNEALAAAIRRLIRRSSRVLCHPLVTIDERWAANSHLDLIRQTNRAPLLIITRRTRKEEQIVRMPRWTLVRIARVSRCSAQEPTIKTIIGTSTTQHLGLDMRILA